MNNLELFNQLCNPNDEALYKKCHNKVPVDKKLYKFDEIKNLKSNQIGYVIQKDFIALDIDSMEHAILVKKIIEASNTKCIINKTRKGMHFIFQKHNKINFTQGVKVFTPIGVDLDIRTAGKGYIILPENDKDREWLNIEENIDVIPYFLYPLKQLKNVPDFHNLSDGDGRNNSLFEHYMKLLDFVREMTTEEKQSSIRILNKFILREPLDKKELEETVIRNNLEKKVKNKTTPEDIANCICDDFNIITHQDNMYMFNGKYYALVRDVHIHKIIHDNYDCKAPDSKRKEIVKFIQLKTFREEIKQHPYIINIRNGRLNLRTLELLPHDEDIIDILNIDLNYKVPQEPNKFIEDFLDFVSDGDNTKRDLLLEMIGYCFMKRNIFQSAFILIGEGRNGKSTFLDIIKNLVGRRNISFIDLADISNNQFKSSKLYGRLANIADDMSFNSLRETNVLKKLISGEEIDADRKFKDSFDFVNFATMIFSANKLPQSHDKTYGFFRRFRIIDFSKQIENPDPFFLDNLNEPEYEYLFYLASVAISKAIKRNKLTVYTKSAQLLEDYKTSISNVLSFFKDESIKKEEIHLYPVSELYNRYQYYCDDSGFKAFNKVNFNDELVRHFKAKKKVTTKDGEDNKTRWVIKEME